MLTNSYHFLEVLEILLADVFFLYNNHTNKLVSY